jgi:hypothetical protein
MTDQQVRDELGNGNITWQDLMLCVFTFSFKCQNYNGVFDFVQIEETKKKIENKNKLKHLMEIYKYEKDPIKKEKVGKEIDLICFDGQTREQMLAHAKRVSDSIAKKEENPENIIKTKLA